MNINLSSLSPLIFSHLPLWLNSRFSSSVVTCSHPRSRGLSLMELLLSIALLSILSTFIVTHMLSAWNASEKNITNIHCAITANNIYEHLLATSTPVKDFLAALPVTSGGELATSSIYQAAGVGRIAVMKEKTGLKTGPATYTIILAEPNYQSGDAFRASFRLNFYVHNP